MYVRDHKRETESRVAEVGAVSLLWAVGAVAEWLKLVRRAAAF